MKNLIFIISIVLFSQSVFAQSIESANQKMKQKDYASAIKEFKTLHKNNPNEIDVINGLILAYINNDQLKDAYKLVDKSIKENPENPILYFNRGRILNLLKRFEKAVEDFEKTISLEPENIADVYFQRGIAYQNIGQLDNSTADFKKAIELDPNSDDYYNFYGITLYKSGEFEKSIEMLDIALSLDDKNPNTHFNQALAYLKIEDKFNACMSLQKACKLGNKNACKLYINKCMKINN